MFDDSPAEVAQDRADFNQTFLTQLATIHRGSIRKDRVASSAVEHKPTDTVRCKVLTSRDGAQIDTEDATVSTISFMVRFPWGTPITANDNIEVDGVMYSVIGEPDTGRANALFVSVVCTKIKG